jgi:hypothetical protein
MGSAVTETLLALLLRLSEADGALLWGRLAKPHFGPPFARLLASGVLVERAPAQEWPTCNSCECGHEARPVVELAGRLIAPCPLDAAADLELESSDLRSFAFNDQRLAELVAADHTEVTAPLPGLWSLGRAADDRWLFLTLRRRVMEDPALLPVLRTVARGTPLTLVAPHAAAEVRHRFLDVTDLRLVDVREAIRLDPDGRLVLEAPAQRANPFVACLSVCLRTRTVEVDGTPQRVPGQPFRLLEILLEAWQRGVAVSKVDLERAFSQRSVGDVVRDLRNALSDGRPDAPIIRGWVLVQGNPAEYRLGLPVGSVQIAR